MKVYQLVAVTGLETQRHEHLALFQDENVVHEIIRRHSKYLYHGVATVVRNSGPIGKDDNVLEAVLAYIFDGGTFYYDLDYSYIGSWVDNLWTYNTLEVY